MKYSENHYSEEIIKDIKSLEIAGDDSNVYWICVTGLHNIGAIQEIGKLFGIHPLILADIANTAQSPKIDVFDSSLFVELKSITFNKTKRNFGFEQVSLLLGPNYVISFLESDLEEINTLKSRIKSGQAKISKYKADYLFYSMIDSIVDNYYLALEEIGEEIENIEDEVIKNPTPKNLESIHMLKRNLIILRKLVWPLREITRRLDIENLSLIRESTAIYLRDLYEHLIQIMETIETQRDIAAEILDIYLSSVSFKLNEVMKVLTIIATIFIPLTFVSSIYGMNFEFFPELHWKYSYPSIMAIMFCLGIWMLWLFKKKKWF